MVTSVQPHGPVGCDVEGQRKSKLKACVAASRTENGFGNEHGTIGGLKRWGESESDAASALRTVRQQRQIVSGTLTSDATSKSLRPHCRRA